MEHAHIDGTNIALPEPAFGWRKAIVGLNRALKPVVAVPAALLVVAEVIVLFVGIISRYVLHAQLSGRTNSPAFCSYGSRCWDQLSLSSEPNTCG